MRTRAVYTEVEESECWANTGKRPLGTRQRDREKPGMTTVRLRRPRPPAPARFPLRAQLSSDVETMPQVPTERESRSRGQAAQGGSTTQGVNRLWEDAM